MFKMHTIYKESHGAVLLLYADLFSPRVIFAVLHIHNNFRTVLTLSSYRCVEREIIYDMGICRFLNSSTDYYGERAKIKRGGGDISLYIVSRTSCLLLPEHITSTVDSNSKSRSRLY